MDDIVIYDKPVDRCRAFMVEYATHLYGIDVAHASALAPLVEIAFNAGERSSDRISAARELAKYTEVPTRSIEYDGGKSGPDLEITVLGACEIRAPDYVEQDFNEIADTKQVATAPSSGSSLELHDAGREEGG
jgi:hypothetical protein